jgi:hypothetical protein
VTTRLRTSLLITIPFVLLLNSDSVIVSTRMYGDVSGVRRVRAEADSSMRDELLKWTSEMTRHFYNEPVHVTTDSVEVSRSNQVHDLAATEGITATAANIVQKPFSLTSEYTWQETVKVDFLGNERERAAAEVITFEYRLAMPGKIASVQPVNAQVDGGSAIWTLNAADLTNAEADFTVSATSTALRWDVIAFLAYIVAYLLYRTIAFLARRARLRPRKI